jgi:hypothetical protein
MLSEAKHLEKAGRDPPRELPVPLRILKILRAQERRAQDDSYRE